MKRHPRIFIWCWITLWACLLALAFAVWSLSERIARYERRIESPPTINTETTR